MAHNDACDNEGGATFLLSVVAVPSVVLMPWFAGAGVVASAIAIRYAMTMPRWCNEDVANFRHKWDLKRGWLGKINHLESKLISRFIVDELELRKTVESELEVKDVVVQSVLWQ